MPSPAGMRGGAAEDDRAAAEAAIRALAPPRRLKQPQYVRSFSWRLAWFRRVAMSDSVVEDPMSSQPLSLLMPLAPKDADKARRSLPVLLENVAHPVTRLAIVAPDHPETRAVAAEFDARFIDEAPPLAALFGADRAAALRGWLRQQFLKMVGNELLEDDHVLAFDADTLLNRRTSWVLPDGRLRLHRSRLGGPPFEHFAAAMLGPMRFGYRNCVAHSMLFRRKDMAGLRSAIEARSGASWSETMLAATNRPEIGMMSEFELLGRWLLRERRDRIAQRWSGCVNIGVDQFFGRAPLTATQRRGRFLSAHDHSDD